MTEVTVMLVIDTLTPFVICNIALFEDIPPLVRLKERVLLAILEYIPMRNIRCVEVDMIFAEVYLVSEIYVFAV